MVTERNLDWMAAVLAILKAGGAYLPIEPHFPADRIATMLSRAGCRLVLTEDGSTTTLDAALDALPGVERLVVDTAYGEGHADDDLGVAVRPDQLAYIYFTSGSTGEPKGAMCEHAGMLNHLSRRSTTWHRARARWSRRPHPQCFDISLWQLVSALLVGGRTLLVEQEVILDVARFVDTIIDGRVAVLQVVPSYLDVVLSYLEQHPRELPDLRVSRSPARPEEGAHAALVRRPARHQAGQRLRAHRDLRRHQPRGHGPGAGRGPGPARPPDHNVRVHVVDEHLRAGAARRARRDRLLRGLRRPRLCQRPRAHRAGVPPDPLPPGAAPLPHRRPRPLAARRQAGVPRPPRQPGQDPRLPDRDRRGRERAAAGARRPRRRRGGRRTGRRRSTWSPSTPAPSRSRTTSCGAAGRVAARVHGPVASSTGGRACR